MILLLNILPWVVVFLAIAASVSLKRVWPSVVGAFFLTIYIFAQPSYLPKGEIKRSDVPAFEQKEVVLHNRMLSPKSGAEYDGVRESKIKEGLPFIEDKLPLIEKQSLTTK